MYGSFLDDIMVFGNKSRKIEDLPSKIKFTIIYTFMAAFFKKRNAEDLLFIAF